MRERKASGPSLRMSESGSSPAGKGATRTPKPAAIRMGKERSTAVRPARSESKQRTAASV